MTAIGDDGFYPLPAPSLYQTGRLFGCVWDLAEAFASDSCMGLSLHRTREEAKGFAAQYYEGLDRKYGVRVAPPEYMRVSSSFIVQADDRLIDLVSDQVEKRFLVEDRLRTVVGRHTQRDISRSEPIGGIYVTIPTAKYLPRLALVHDVPDEMSSVVRKSQEDFIEELMTVERVLVEVLDDTQRWHDDVAKGTADDQWA